MKQKFYICVILTIILIFICLFTSGCVPGFINTNHSEGGDTTLEKNFTTLQELAFNRARGSPYIIGIEENGELVPYLILTDDYDGKCLLLRESLLDKQMRFNPNGRFSSYYENSEIDNYLNSEFLDSLSSAVRSKIAISNIIITARESLGVCGTETKTIERNIFLLSYSELGGIKSSTNVAEGSHISYFKNNESRIAKHSSGEVDSWGLRTPNTWYDNVVCGVSIDGVVGMGGVGGGVEDYVNGVRPAFCLNRNTEVIKSNELINDHSIYVLQ